MTNKIPLKANFTGNTATSLAEFESGDVVDIIHGGTGANTAADARNNLGLSDTVAKAHDQNTDTALALGTTDEVTASGLRTHIFSTDNPHSVTKAQVGLGNVDNVSAADLRDRSTHTGTQTLATISDAGTAATADVTTSATDTTAGRLLKVGDFGVGADNGLAGLGDFHDTTKLRSGIWWRYDSGVANRPGDGNGGAIFLHRSGGRGVWLAGDQNGALFIKGQRDAAGANFTSWRELYHTRNLLGTVSQSAGVPTGAVIERGSNGTGEYVRYADGTVFAWRVVNIDLGSSSQVDFDYPISPISQSSESFNSFSTTSILDRLRAINSIQTTQIGNSQWRIRVVEPRSSSDIQPVMLFVAGRWF